VMHGICKIIRPEGRETSPCRLRTLESRVTSLSGGLFAAGFVACASLIPTQVHAESLTGVIDLGLQRLLYINYTVHLTAHPSSDAMSTTYIRPIFDIGPIWFADLGPDIHGTTSSHGIVATWEKPKDITGVLSGLLVAYTITPLVELSPECNANFSSCKPVSASTAISVEAGPGVIPDNNAASVARNGTEVVPGPLPLFGVGAAFGYSRKLRKRIKLNRLPIASTIE
jgi:hypothetical protein